MARASSGIVVRQQADALLRGMMAEDDDRAGLLSQSESKHGGVDNLDEKIGRLLKVLQRLPPSAEAKGDFSSPEFQGKLLKESNSLLAVNRWKPFWFRLCGTNLIYSKKEGGKKKGKIPIAFCTVDKLEYSKEDIGGFSEAFIDQLESQQAAHRFRIYSKRQIFFFQAESEEELQKWIKAICGNLDELLGEDELEAKTIAAQNLEPLLKQQMHEQYERHKQVLRLLEATGLVQDVSPLANRDKEKEGYLQLMKKDSVEGESRWKKYYFVLLSGCIYYYKSSQDEEPTGVVSLRHAEVKVSKSSIKKGRFIFKVKTVFRTLFLRAKHEAAMQAWLTQIDFSRAKLGGYEPSKAGRTLVGDLERYKVDRTWDDLDDFLIDRRGRSYLKKFLNKEGQLFLFKFHRDAADFSKQAEGTDEDLTEKAQKLFERYVCESGERFIPLLAGQESDIADAISRKTWDTAFSVAYEMSKQSLRDEWLPQMRKSKYFTDLKRATARPEDMAEEIVGDKYLTVYTDCSTKQYKLKVGKFKIGRDTTNDLALRNDPRVSREHCYIEVDEQDRIMVCDLGSSRGTKVNGDKIVRHGLRLTDEIIVGKTTMRVTNEKKSKSKK